MIFAVFECQLVAPVGEFVLVALHNEDHRREEQVEDRGERRQNGKREPIGRRSA
jgi:hypothetical protein